MTATVRAARAGCREHRRRVGRQRRGAPPAKRHRPRTTASAPKTALLPQPLRRGMGRAGARQRHRHPTSTARVTGGSRAARAMRSADARAATFPSPRPSAQCRSARSCTAAPRTSAAQQACGLRVCGRSRNARPESSSSPGEPVQRKARAAKASPKSCASAASSVSSRRSRPRSPDARCVSPATRCSGVASQTACPGVHPSAAAALPRRRTRGVACRPAQRPPRPSQPASQRTPVPKRVRR